MIQKICSKIHPVSCTKTQPDVTNLVNHGIVKQKQKLQYLKTEHNFSMKQKNSKPVPQMAHFERLWFCCGGNL